jgi:hypothetical protein
MALKVIHHGDVSITIIDQEEDVSIYSGPAMPDHIIEAMAFYYGENEEIEYEEKELGKAQDPLDASIDGDESEIDENAEVININFGSPIQDDGQDWPSDNED